MITKKDLILTEDTTFNESIKVRGNIKGDYNLKVLGNIDCRNIDCGNINGGYIDCRNIILCNKFKSTGKVKAKSIIKDRFNIKQKEFSKDGDLK